MKNNRRMKYHVIVSIACILIGIMFLAILWLVDLKGSPELKDGGYDIADQVIQSLAEQTTEEVSYDSIRAANVPILFFYLILTMVAGCSLAFYWFLGKKQTIRRLRLAGWFAVAASSYGMSSNYFTKLIMENSRFLLILELLSILCVTAVLASILKSAQEGIFRKLFGAIFYIALGTMITEIVWDMVIKSNLGMMYRINVLLYDAVFVLLFASLFFRRSKGVRPELIILIGWGIDFILKETIVLYPSHFCAAVGIILYLLLEMQDVRKELHELRMEMYQTDIYRTLAYTDYMTKANNRNALIEDMTYYHMLNKKPVWCVFIDLNNLKEVNDQKGHVHGDQMIQQMADMLKIEFDGCGKVYRIGGDEFLILVSDKEQSFMEDKVAALKKYRNKGISFAIGYDSLREKETLESLIERVDKLMYQDKKCDKTKTEDEFNVQ